MNYERIEQAIRFIEEHRAEQPSLNEIAASIALSPYHFDRLFKEWAGVTPKQFMAFLTLEHAKRLLDESSSVLEASYEAGLSGPSRLHDHFVTLDAVTPGQYKRGGEGLDIAYGVHDTRFGRCLLGVTERGICSLQFVDEASMASRLDQLQAAWPEARFYEDARETQSIVAQIMDQAHERPDRALHLRVKGTNFQVKVWQALLGIPPGYVFSYEQVAELAGHPGAARAVSRAIAQNPVGYLIPCHRVVRKTGASGGYLWGRTRKKVLLGWEAAQRTLAEEQVA